MSQVGKDSPEVIEFMMLFARLKDWSDDAPDELPDQAAADSSVKELCSQLSLAACLLERNERKRRQLFAAPVDPTFLLAWRDYEDRYQTVLSDIWLSELFSEIGVSEASDIPKADVRWDNADVEAMEQASGIAKAINFADENIGQEDRWVDQPEFVEYIQEGIAAWERLSEETGFDMRGVFRRRALVPFVLVPRAVANRYGGSEKPSMLKNLQQAHHAFVFGAPYAALALMRSIMEAVLRDLYRVEGGGLGARINNARWRPPRGTNKPALNLLKQLADEILHLDPPGDARLPKMDEERLEKEIVRLLFVLRALIEGVK